MAPKIVLKKVPSNHANINPNAHNLITKNVPSIGAIKSKYVLPLIDAKNKIDNMDNPYSRLPNDLLMSIATAQDLLSVLNPHKPLNEELIRSELVCPIIAQMKKQLDHILVNARCTKEEYILAGAIYGFCYHGIVTKDLSVMTRATSVAYGYSTFRVSGDTKKADTLLNTCDINIARLALQLLGIPRYLCYLRTPKENTQLLTLKSGKLIYISDPNIESEMKILRSRFNIIDNTSIIVKNVLFKLYEVSNIEDITILPIHPLEPYIIGSNNSNEITKIAHSVGMRIPAYVNPLSYFYDNILQYAYIKDCKDCKDCKDSIGAAPGGPNVINDYKYMTDDAIFISVNAVFFYSNREDLLHRAKYSHQKSIFSVAIDRKKADLENKETLYANSVYDPSIFMICYGILGQKQKIYEVSELVASFKPVEQKAHLARMPDDFTKVFSPEALKELKSLLSQFTSLDHDNLNLCKELVKYIDMILSKDSEGIMYVRDRSIDLPFVYKANLKNIMYHLFYTGMYMRRWKGPGNKYPLSGNDTYKSGNPEKKVLESTFLLMTEIEQLPKNCQSWLRNLKVFTYARGVFNITNADIGSMIDSVNKGDMCIRMSSSNYITTSYFYLMWLFDIIIPNVDISKLDPIS